MKKFTFAIVLMAVLVSTGYAQKNIDVNNVVFSYLTRSFPARPLTPIYYSYGKQVILNFSSEQILSKDMLESKLEIQGEQYTEDPKKEDVVYKLYLDNANTDGVEIKTEEVTDKEKNETKTYYYILASINGSTRAALTQGGKEIWKMTIRDRNASNPIEYKSGRYTSSKECKSNWDLNREGIIAKYTNQFAKEALETANQIVSKNYGFPLTQEYAMLETMKTKKHPENDEFRAKVDALKSLLAALNGNTPLKEADMQPFIDYFKSIPEKYPTEGLKSDIKIRYAAYYNLAQIYACMDKFDESINYCDLLIKNEFDKKDGISLKEKMMKAKESISQRPVDIKVRQFDPAGYFGQK